MVKEPRHKNGLAMIMQGKKKEVHSFEPSKTAQAVLLADLHVSHHPKMCLNLVFVQEINFVLLIALTPGFKDVIRGVSVLEHWGCGQHCAHLLCREGLCLPSSVHLQQQCQANPIFQLVLSATGKLQRCLFNS